MNTNLIKLFPTTISITENFLTNDELEFLLKVVRDLETDKHEVILGKGVSSNTVKDYFPFGRGVKDKLVEKINEYTDTMGLYRVSIDNSWFNIQYPDSHLEIHNHPNSKVSGALYLKIDEKSSELVFHDAHPYHTWREHTTNNNYNGDKCSIKPSVGMLVLFPSWLKHSSNINKSSERIVVSFNTNDLDLPLVQYRTLPGERMKTKNFQK